MSTIPLIGAAVSLLLSVGPSDGPQDALQQQQQVDVLWGRFSLNLPTNAQRLMVQRSDELAADGFPRDERVWLDYSPSDNAPTFMLVAKELGALEGRSGLIKNMESLLNVANKAEASRRTPRASRCGNTPCVEYDGAIHDKQMRLVVGFLIAVGGEVVSIEFVTIGIEGDLLKYRERARALMSSFVPGPRRMRSDARAEAPICCGNRELSFPTPPGFYFQARLTPYFKTFEIREFADPENSKISPIRVVWLVGDASTSPTRKSVQGRLWGTPCTWTVEESGSLSYSFWNLDHDSRRNKIIVSGLKTRAVETQTLIDGIKWDGIEQFKQAVKSKDHTN